MKPIIFFAVVLIAPCLLHAQNIGIGTNNPHPSAQLDVSATNRGLLIPRVTEANRPASPATGLLIFQTNNRPGFYFYNGSAWQSVPNTLNRAYNQGGSGVGRTITADAGAVSIMGTGGLQVGGIFGSGPTVEEGIGPRLFFNPRKAAFRAGFVTGTNWDDIQVGNYSIALGKDPYASGENAVAIGNLANATGEGALSLGYTFASGTYATAIGHNSGSSGLGSAAFGHSATASGNYSVALGASAFAVGANSFAVGVSAANGSYSTAIGYANTANGNTATALGYGNTATGDYSLAIGTNSITTGTSATATGSNTSAAGDYSFSGGFTTEAPSYAEVTLGYFSTQYTPLNATAPDPTDRLFTLGNGTGLNRSDALRILKNGRTAIGNINPTTKLDIDGQLRIRGGSPGVGKVLTSDANGLATWQTAAGAGSLNTAYNFGGAGAGRIITANAGAVKIEGPFSAVEAIVNSNAGVALSGTSLGGLDGVGVDGMANAGYGVRGTVKGIGYGVYAYQDVTHPAIGAALYAKTISTNGIAAFFESANPLSHALITGSGKIRLNSLKSLQTRLVSVDPNGDLNTLAYVPWEPNDNGAHYMPGNPAAARIGIGTSVPAARLHVAHNSVFGGTSQLLLEETENDYARMTLRSTSNSTRWDVAGFTSATNANAELNFFFSGLNTNVLSLRGNGNAIVHGTVTANGVLLTSDVRLKKDIQLLGNPLQQLSLLSGYQYHWNDSGLSSQLQTGLLAQEVEQVFPHMVYTDENGNKSVAYNSLIPLLLEAVKHLQQQVNALENKISKIQ